MRVTDSTSRSPLAVPVRFVASDFTAFPPVPALLMGLGTAHAEAAARRHSVMSDPPQLAAVAPAGEAGGPWGALGWAGCTRWRSGHRAARHESATHPGSAPSLRAGMPWALPRPARGRGSSGQGLAPGQRGAGCSHRRPGLPGAMLPPTPFPEKPRFRGHSTPWCDPPVAHNGLWPAPGPWKLGTLVPILRKSPGRTRDHGDRLLPAVPVPSPLVGAACLRVSGLDPHFPGSWPGRGR